MELIYSLFSEFIQLGFGIYVLLISINIIETPSYLSFIPFKSILIKSILILYVARRLFVIYALFVQLLGGWDESQKFKVLDECKKQSMNEGLSTKEAKEVCDCFLLNVVEKFEYYKFASANSKDTLRVIYKNCAQKK